MTNFGPLDLGSDKHGQRGPRELAEISITMIGRNMSNEMAHNDLNVDDKNSMCSVVFVLVDSLLFTKNFVIQKP